jgi:hypothetical protein
MAKHQPPLWLAGRQNTHISHLINVPLGQKGEKNCCGCSAAQRSGCKSSHKYQPLLLKHGEAKNNAEGDVTLVCANYF